MSTAAIGTTQTAHPLAPTRHVVVKPAAAATTNAAAAAPLDLDSLIGTLRAYRTAPPHTIRPVGLGFATEGTLLALCRAAREVFLRQPMLVTLEAPVTIAGDIHGQYFDLLRVFELAELPPPYTQYLFLGDYVDRGAHSLETITLLLALKVQHPTAMWLLRGNHECASVNMAYGFYDECKRRASVSLWKAFVDVFNVMPVAAIVSGCMFCCHGGLSPELTSWESLQAINALQRPCDIPHVGLMCDLLWADPSPDHEGWSPNDRGVSFTFGKDVLHAFLARTGLQLVVRAHQVVEDGYEFFGGQKLVTVFTAPNYCGDTRNVGCVMRVQSDLLCSFQGLHELVTEEDAVDAETNASAYE